MRPAAFRKSQVSRTATARGQQRVVAEAGGPRDVWRDGFGAFLTWRRTSVFTGAPDAAARRGARFYALKTCSCEALFLLAARCQLAIHISRVAQSTHTQPQRTARDSIYQLRATNSRKVRMRTCVPWVFVLTNSASRAGAEPPRPRSSRLRLRPRTTAAAAGPSSQPFDSQIDAHFYPGTILLGESPKSSFRPTAGYDCRVYSPGSSVC